VEKAAKGFDIEPVMIPLDSPAAIEPTMAIREPGYGLIFLPELPSFIARPSSRWRCAIDCLQFIPNATLRAKAA
jgi:hypothetical protein